MKLAIIAGEESGDLLAADCVSALLAQGQQVELCGVGGHHLQALGLKTLFDQSEIALMGFSEVITKVPRLLRLIKKTADYILAQEPDMVLIVDAPDFTHRVAKRLKQARPELKIIQYVCPSVWAWRPQRAIHMRAFIDHVLAILPFEPEEMKRLKGPITSFVGHPLVDNADVKAVRSMRASNDKKLPQQPLKLLCLPGSRSAEIKNLLPDMHGTVESLSARGHTIEVFIHTPARHLARIKQQVANWPTQPKISTTNADKWQAFAQCDCAIASSGTVLLELALCDVPMISIYRLDFIARIFVACFSRLFPIWSAALPNIIADQPYVNEYINQYIRPQKLAREIEALTIQGPAQDHKKFGNACVLNAMKTPIPAGQKAAEILVSYLPNKKGPKV